MEKNWEFAEVWNAALLEREDRPLKVRDNLWASELGKAPIDIFLKLKATPVTNPPNPRSLRKFEAGNVFEWIISLILKRAGILQESQRWSSHQYEGLLKVTGKADFIAGGKPDIEKWRAEMGALELPNVFIRSGERILRFFQENYPDGLEEMPLEIKSVSAFMFDALERRKSSSRIHRLQAFHYLKSENRPRTKLVYVCRDDLRLMEFSIGGTPELEAEYRGAIENISKYVLADEKPPLEKPVVFDDDIGKFAKNFNVAYSNYLTLLYGFEDQSAFDARYQPMVARWNRVMKRLKDGANVTDKNKEILDEIKVAGFNVDELLPKFVGGADEEEQ